MENREFMTPEEKAVDLVWSFYGKLEHTLNDEYSKNDWNLCVSCAQDVVNAIENFMYMDDIDSDTSHNVNSKWVKYWLDVKFELEKLFKPKN
jgi:hypothetical protein